MFGNIKKILKKKDSKTLLGNFLSLSALQFVGIILPLIILPYLIRVIGFSKYGIVVLAFSLISYFQSVTDYSFKITATRDVALFKNSPQKLNLIYSKVLIVKAIFISFSCLIITSIVLLYPPFYEERRIFFLSMPLLLGYGIFPEWFFQGIEKMRYIAILNISIKLFFTLCVFVFITEESDYWLYPFLQSLGLIIAGVVGQYILIRKYKLQFVALKPRFIKNTIKDNFPIFVNQFLPTLYNNTTTLILGLFATSYLVGIYDALKKITDISIIFISVVSRVFFPFLNRKKEAFSNYRKLILILAILLIVLPIIFHPLVVYYLNLSYSNSLVVTIILSTSVLGYALYDIYGLNYFIIRRMDKLVMRNTAYASIFSFLLAFPLIYYFNIIGAASNLLIARYIMGGGLLYKYKKNNYVR